MRQARLDAAVEPANVADDAPKPTRIEIAALPRQMMQLKSLRFDVRAVAVVACCNVDLEAGVARGARHRQAVRYEVPVLGDEIDDAR